MAIDLAIFDCDGVLVDSEVLASRLLAEAVSALGYPLSPEQSRERFTGKSIRQVVAAIEADWGRTLPVDFEEKLRARDLAVFARELQAVPGIAAALPNLGIPICVASSGAPEKIRHSLNVTGLNGFFNGHLFSAHAVRNGKPAPDLFLHAAETMGVVPERCAVIEDSVAGVTGGAAAGMTVLGFTGGGHCTPATKEALRRAGAHIVFKDMTELPGLIRQLNG